MASLDCAPVSFLVAPGVLSSSAVPFCVRLFNLHTLAESGTYGIPPDFRGGVYLFILPYAIGSVPSLSGHALAYRWRSLPRVRRHRASSPQGNSSDGCCLCRSPWNVRLSFPTPIIGMKEAYYVESMQKYSIVCTPSRLLCLAD